MNYDLLILCHPKDYVKLNYCIDSCVRFLNPLPENIYVVSPDHMQGVALGKKIIHVFDDHAIPVTKSDLNYRRSNWIWKMMVNMFQNFTKNEYYLTVDCDLFFNKKHDLFENDKPVFFISDREQHHKPYFDFMEKWNGLTRQTDYTFINDFMMLNKSVCREILPDVKEFLNFCNNNLSEDCLMADYEMYGNHVEKYHKDMYISKSSKTKMLGRYANQPWSEQEIIECRNFMQDKDYDLFTIHSWT